MKKIKEQVKDIASQYGLQIIYAFGSRAKEALDMVEGRIEEVSSKPSDLDIGVKPENPLLWKKRLRLPSYLKTSSMW